jgi:hypothetical protein
VLQQESVSGEMNLRFRFLTAQRVVRLHLTQAGELGTLPPAGGISLMQESKKEASKVDSDFWK